MASRSVSPGGALLRASRVFAIPPPLPRPMGDLSSQAIFSSDTATLPHPVHLSITTPQASLARGDWGFKRPLPLRSTTKTSTPFIRVEAIDTFEHVTEFGSSADHAITLQKWQEMGIPLSTSIPDRNRGEFKAEVRKSVFDDDIDTIAESEGGILGNADSRWKFKGPWLAGQTEGNFKNFLSNEVRKRKGEFRKYLQKACADALTKEARQEATGEMPPAIQASDVTEEQLAEYVKRLRNTRTELFRLIRSFLDLAPTPSAKRQLEDMLLSSLTEGRSVKVSGSDLPVSVSPYAETGPPKTHPSAGIAYSRSDAYLYNHPVFGPQAKKAPVQARVVMPKNAATGNFAAALGVGGFVTEVPAGLSDSFNMSGRKTGGRQFNAPQAPGVISIEPDKVGGSKIYVHPSHARVDPKGRVVLSVLQAAEEAVAVHEGTTDKIPAKMELSKLAGSGFVNRSTRYQPRNTGYGLNLDGGASKRNVPVAREASSTSRRPDNALKELTELMGHER